VVVKRILILLVGFFLYSSMARSAVTINIVQSDGDVVATSTGSLNLNSLTAYENNLSSSNGFVQDNGSSNYISVGQSSPRSIYSITTGITFLTGFGTYVSNASSGTAVGIISGTTDILSLPTAYSSGDLINSTSTWSSKTITDLGMVTGTYVVTLPSDTITINIGPVVDATDPTLQSSSPANNATGVAVGSNIVLTFDEAVDVESGNITIKKTSDNSFIETIDVTGSLVTGTGTTTITVNPTSNLANSTEYYVQIDPTAFDDAAGNSYAGISSTTALSFTTVAAVDATDPTLQSSSPVNNATGVAVGSNIVLTFDEAVDVESGNITIKKTSDNSIIETIDVTGSLVTGTGTTTITVNPTSDLANSTEFYVQIDAAAFDDAAGNSYAGILSTTALSFTTAAVVDETGPTLQSSSPADNATGVAVGSNIVLTFDEAVDAETGNITIKKTSDNSIIETIDVTGGLVTGTGTTTITVNPTSDLANSTEYYVQIDPAAFDDAAGNSYAGISSTTALSFTTAVVDATDPTLQSSSPANNATGVAVGSNIVLTFDEAVDAETGNITIKRTLDDSTVEILASTSIKVTGSGTSVITVNPTSDLAVDTEYYVLIDGAAFDDSSSNSYAGISSSTALSFTTATANSNPFDDDKVVGLIQAQTQTVARVATQALGTVGNRLSQLIANSSDKTSTANNSYQGIKLALNFDAELDQAISQTGLLTGLNSSGDIFNNGWAVWTDGSVTLGEGKGGSDFQIDGLTFGIDKRVTPLLTVGAALRVAQEDNDIGSDSSVDSDAYSATAYASYVLNNNFYAQGAFGYSDIDISSKRTSGVDVLEGNRDADQVYMSLSLTKELEHMGMTLLPYGSFNGSYSTLDKYSETGSNQALTYHKQNVKDLSVTLGVRGQMAIQKSYGLFVPRFHVNYQGHFNSDSDAQVNYVSVPSTTFSSSFDASSSSSWLFGLGADYMYDTLMLTVDYERTQNINWGHSDTFRLTLSKDF